MEKELEEKIKQVAILEERSRILSELDLANLPAGVWFLIKNIIVPTTKQK